MSGLQDKIHNETTKLTATFINGVAVAIFAVGGVAPTMGLVSGQTPVGSWTAILVFAAICYIFSGVLHIVARRTLRGMRDDDD